MNTNQWRNRRNQLNLNPIPAFGMYSISNYSTDSRAKSDLTKTFAEEMLIHNLHMIPNPLQKNLADTMPTAEPKPKQAFTESKMEKEQPQRSDYYPSFTGIGSFFSGVLSAISGGMFQRRRSPAPQYYDCFDRDPTDWQASKREDLNKSTRVEQSGNDDAMSADCRAAAAHCEDKLNRVRHLLTTKPVPTTPKFRRQPRRAFIEPGSVEESFEDAFSPEDFVRLSNDVHIECYSPYNNHKEEMIEAEAPKVNTDMAPVKEVMDIVQTLSEVDVSQLDNASNETIVGNRIEVKNETKTVENQKDNKIETKTIENHIAAKNETQQLEAPSNSSTEQPTDEKREIIASCEDKVNRLKALLQCRKPRTSRLTRPESTDSITESATDKRDNHNSLKIDKPQDKHFKNPNRGTDKRKKSQMMKNIQDDMCFANTLEPEDVSSPDNSPSFQPTKLCDLIPLCPKVKEQQITIKPEPEPEYFDEVHGRFRSTSTTDSEDSFQIVFTDSPKANRSRKVSDCDSEDSFIVFEDSPDSCYTSHDVFGDTSEAGEDSDSDSDVSDSGCGVSCKLSHSLTRTVGDLTDDSLFDDTVRADSEDEVDSAVRVCEEIPEFTEEPKNTGLLLTDAKKLLRRQQPPKKVSFSEKPPKVRVMRVWSFAARQARRGDWEQHALDRDRFKRKIADVDMAVSWVLKPQHRSRVMFQRFMPWWNAQRRLEIAEKKRKQEEERIKAEERKQEEERIKAEEERLKAEDSEAIYHKAIRKICERYGKSYTKELENQCYGSTDRQLSETVVQYVMLPISVDDFEHQLSDIVGRTVASAPLQPGAERLLTHLHDHKIPFALATNSTEAAVRIHATARPKLFALFNHKVCATDPEVDRGKPNPDIYLVAASRFPARPKPAECLVFEDSHIGMKAGVEAGMQVVMIPDKRLDREKTREATKVIRSLLEFKPEEFGLPPFPDAPKSKANRIEEPKSPDRHSRRTPTRVREYSPASKMFL